MGKITFKLHASSSNGILHYLTRDCVSHGVISIILESFFFFLFFFLKSTKGDVFFSKNNLLPNNRETVDSSREIAAISTRLSYSMEEQES